MSNSPVTPRSLLVPGLALALAGSLALTATQASAQDSGKREAAAPPARQQAGGLAKQATATGYGGAVSSVDPTATRVGLKVLKQGGNAVDAAVATAAALGVTEPYSAGIGGGGYFVYYNAKKQKVSTIDGRETAPAAMKGDAFIDKATGKPYNFTPELVTSGVSVGVPGTLATWDRAMRKWGTLDLAGAMKPARKVARKGFRVDDTFRSQTLDNKVRFDAFTSTRELYLPGGDAPAVDSVFKNKALARTYAIIARKGIKAFYNGKLSGEIVKAVTAPPKTSTTKLPVPVGSMTRADLKNYKAIPQKPSKVGYRGYDVYGMAPSSSGGSTVGEALNILEQYDVGSMSDADALHRYLEASALAFADRGKYLGDPRFVDVPLDNLLSDTFAKERACSIDPAKALTKPVAAGDVAAYDGVCTPAAAQNGAVDTDTENISTTNLTVTDKDGNVVEYTLTIEQTGGSGIVVPHRGFLLNNELTDFSTVYVAADPNRIQPGKRPRSSMSPTIILKDRKPFLALGSPGGSTIITTVLQMIFNRIDRDMTVQEAIAAPRATQRNTANVTAEPAFITAYDALLKPLGHKLVPAGDAFTSAAEIGAATAIEFGRKGKVTAVAEPVRRGGGAAGVVSKRRR
ncbi:gamma-glutamyltransferase [Nocardioides sp. InS609-2]|uniref:gamma-glutamyltransferase n=1 Tax=Nocardioides sp. InS609-2 TaxID=2760705 RepID=UPI0020BDB7C0|nr:gamma-glutamyltransferase [Nocardioides sp. InS609-2]